MRVSPFTSLFLRERSLAAGVHSFCLLRTTTSLDVKATAAVAAAAYATLLPLAAEGFPNRYLSGHETLRLPSSCACACEMQAASPFFPLLFLSLVSPDTPLDRVTGAQGAQQQQQEKVEEAVGEAGE